MNRPAEVIDKINTAVNAVLPPQIKARYAFGAEPMIMTPAEFGKFLAAETEKRGKARKTAHIKVEWNVGWHIA